MKLDLDQRLLRIGFRLATSSSATRKNAREWVDIEQTLLDALERIAEDPRLASLVFSWMKVHGSHVIVEKIRKFANDAPAALRWLPALAAQCVEDGHHKWRKLLMRAENPVLLLPESLTRSAVRIKGSVPWLERWNLIIPQGVLRIREEDVLTPRELIAANLQYRNRYLYGPSWRADIISAIQFGAASPTEVVRLIHCSYEPAHRIFTEYHLAQTA